MAMDPVVRHGNSFDLTSVSDSQQEIKGYIEVQGSLKLSFTSGATIEFSGGLHARSGFILILNMPGDFLLFE
ncbi:hypothetical protein RYX36_032090 [Vicia faba]